MLSQWRYKVCEWFAIQGEDIIVGEFLSGYRGGRVRPDRMFIYRPSKRMYDYVDYSGTSKGKEVGVSDLTCFLEVLGYIKFVDKQNEQAK